MINNFKKNNLHLQNELLFVNEKKEGVIKLRNISRNLEFINNI